MSSSHESQETPLRMAEQLESISSSGRGRASEGYIGALSQVHCRISFGHLSTSFFAHHSKEDTVVGNIFGDQSNFGRPGVTPEPSPPINSRVMRPCPVRTFTLCWSPPDSSSTFIIQLPSCAHPEAAALFQPYHHNFK